MEQVACLMHLKKGNEALYRRRHDEIWPELKAALSEAGICDYSIFLDEETGNLFAVMRRKPGHSCDKLPDLPVMRRWWDAMADLMDVDATNKPIERALRPMFHMD
jgi:L-rhamnose mutarotase